MNEITADDIQRTLRDGAYVTIGLGLLAFQRIQVRRQELHKQVGGNVTDARSMVADQCRTAHERLGAVEDRLDGALDDVEAQLPEQARSVVHQFRAIARSVTTDTRSQIIDLVDGA